MLTLVPPETSPKQKHINTWIHASKENQRNSLVRVSFRKITGRRKDGSEWTDETNREEAAEKRRWEETDQPSRTQKSPWTETLQVLKKGS